MNEQQWNYFCNFREDFKNKISEWGLRIPELKELQKAAAISAKTPPYEFQTPVVYNRDLDKISRNDQIKLIVIGDNPGKDEQLAVNNRYLVGQAGKIAEGYFKRNPELQIDFRKNVIILNKTPVHSAKTAQLKIMAKSGGKKMVDLLLETQLWMAEQTANLQKNLQNFSDMENPGPELWLVGYSELKNKGIFIPYRNELKKNFEKAERGQTSNEMNTTGGQTSLYLPSWNSVYIFQHFSMNRFSIDLQEYINNEKLGDRPLIENLHALGTLHKNQIFDEE